MKILAVSPVPDYATRDVWEGHCAGLEALGAEVIRMDYGRIWSLFSAFREFAEVTAAAEPGTIDHFLMAGDRIVMSALVNEVDLVYAVAPMHISATTFKVLRSVGLKTAAYFTECPYDDDWVLQFAELVDVPFVCDRASLGRFREHNPRAAYVGHAYDPARHQPNGNGRQKSADVVFVGTSFPSRVAFLEQVDWEGIDLHLHGLMQIGRSPLRPYVQKNETMQNADAIKLYQQARIGLQLHRRDTFLPLEAMKGRRHGRGLVGAKPLAGLEAYSIGPRCYELAACGVFQVSDDSRPELEEVFGDTVPAYSTPETLGLLLRRYLDEPDERERLGALQREAVAPHTFQARMKTVLEAVS